MLYFHVLIVEIRYKYSQDLITLSWPIHAWGSFLPRRLASPWSSRLPPLIAPPASVGYLCRELLFPPNPRSRKERMS
jgi:hypothetical protein